MLRTVAAMSDDELDAMVGNDATGRLLRSMAEDETVQFGALEMWEFINAPAGTAFNGGSGRMMGHNNHMGHSTQTEQTEMASGGMMDFMAHPIHMHGVQFQVVERTVSAEQQAGWETLKAGFVDEGWKDTVLVMPGERVKVLVS